MIDLWHFVNGKALVHGLNLGELEASDMLDVGQYFMEEEMIRQHDGGVDIPGAVRDHLYRELYNVKYPYYTPVGGRSSRADGLDEPLDDDVVPFDPKSAAAEPVKAYTPPTSFDPDNSDPFGGVLDAPIG